MESICKVKGTGPSGIVTHALTAMSAIDKPTNAIERVLDDAPDVVLLVFFDVSIFLYEVDVRFA